MEKYSINFDIIDSKNINLILQEYGFVIIENVINNSEYYIDKIWDWLENLQSGICRYDTNTWIPYQKAKKNNLSYYNWPKSSYGVITYGVNHANFVWQARTDKNIKKVFEYIWPLPAKAGILKIY
jgi:hypothetical protein